MRITLWLLTLSLLALVTRYGSAEDPRAGSPEGSASAVRRSAAHTESPGQTLDEVSPIASRGRGTQGEDRAAWSGDRPVEAKSFRQAASGRQANGAGQCRHLPRGKEDPCPVQAAERGRT